MKKTKEQLQAEFRAKLARLDEINAKEVATPEEREERGRLLTEGETLQRDIEDADREERMRLAAPAAVEFRDGAPVVVVDAPIYRGSAHTALGAQLADIRAVTIGVDVDQVREARGRLDQAEKRTRHMIEQNAKKEGRAAGDGIHSGVSTEGGFLLQGETSVDLMRRSVESSPILSKCKKRTLTASDFIEIVGIDEPSRKDGYRHGGIQVYTRSELANFTGSKPKFNMIRIEPAELTGLCYISDKMLRNVTFLGQEVTDLFGDAFRFKTQNLALWGKGNGEPLGIMNSKCLVTVPKETDQVNDTIVAMNILKMDAALSNDSSPSAMWMLNRDCKPQLATAAVVSGDGATLLYKTYNNMGVRAAELNGTIAHTIEQCSTVGDLGDIILADWADYIIADRGDINEASSIHVKFEQAQTVFRFIYEFDGQPRWATSLEPYKGSNKTSMAVALAAR